MARLVRFVRPAMAALTGGGLRTGESRSEDDQVDSKKCDSYSFVVYSVHGGAEDRPESRASYEVPQSATGFSHDSGFIYLFIT